MDATELSFGIVILTQLSLGLSVNLFLLLFYIHVVSTSHKPSSSDLILAHLALANTIILLTIGIPEVMSAWGLRNFLDDVGCKALMYLYRVARGLAICTTCLLSVFQAVTISPGTSWWAGIKAKLPKCIFPSFLLSWVLNLLIELDTAIYMISPQTNGSFQIMLDIKYCSEIGVNEETTLVITVVLFLRDLFFVGLMSLASGYMVLVLHRHHRQVQHLHGPGRSPRAMPEIRAAKRVIALVTLYILLYGRQTIMLSILLNMKKSSPLLVKSHLVFLLTFSTLSPFLIIHGDRRIRTFWKRESSTSNPDHF
ncbi:olfactory receptor class A-like protein 1 [Ornithorhynchus anatinus]|uniref:Vomeronasal type-1 receptor n=1 Tax=Ornithorhynchus anatinus TaxID=9258 RepID=A0A6I8N2E1_ORNAN|nr:olfactory receptor class A-like protein 1 [Ornithorhynchus anatinus]